MLTIRQNLLETIHGGNPDRFVNQYEFLKMISNPSRLHSANPKRGEMGVANAWGVIRSWPEHVVAAAPEMSSEDFAEYGKEVPSFFYWLGSGFPDRENAGWHSEQFCTNDSALPLDAALLARSALTALGYEG